MRLGTIRMRGRWVGVLSALAVLTSAGVAAGEGLKIKPLEERALAALTPEARGAYEKGMMHLDHMAYRLGHKEFEKAIEAAPRSIELRYLAIELARYQGQMSFGLDSRQFFDTAAGHAETILSFPDLREGERERAEYTLEKARRLAGGIEGRDESRRAHGWALAKIVAKEIYKDESEQTKAFQEALKAIQKGMPSRPVGAPPSSLQLPGASSSAPGPAASPTGNVPDPAVMEIQRAGEQIQSMTADYLMEMSMQGGMTMSMTGPVATSGEMMSMDLVTDVAGQKTSTKMVMDKDGIMWIEFDMAGQVGVMKMDAKAMAEGQTPDELQMIPGGDSLMQSPTDAIAGLSQTYNLISQGTASIDGIEVVQFTGTLHEDAKAEAGAEEIPPVVNVLFGKADGIPRKMAFPSPEGGTVLTITYSNVQTNVQIDESRFVYTPPPGVEVQDMSAIAAMTDEAMQP